MLERLRGRLTYANVMSTIAVLFAVGGGAAYAANTVFSGHIVNGEVKTLDIADDGVNAQDIAAEPCGRRASPPRVCAASTWRTTASPAPTSGGEPARRGRRNPRRPRPE